MNRILIIIFVVSLALTVGCEEKIKSVVEYTDGVAIVNMFASEMMATRVVPEGIDEGTADGYRISDFWLFEYKDDGKIVGSPRYFKIDKNDDMSNLSVPLIIPPENVEYTCLIIANTHDEDLFSGSIDFSTLQAFKSAYKEITQYSDLYQSVNGQNDLIMNGSFTLTNEDKTVDCELYRNVVRLDVSLINSVNSGITLNTIQIKSVSNHMFYFDRAYDGVQLCPSADQSSFINLPIINVASGISGTSSDYTFYLPRNMRGTNLSLDREGKNVNAPKDATYLEVMATDNVSGSPIRYNFYLGKNMVNDFNLEPNWKYTIKITFDDKGDQYIDSRIEDISSIVLEESNSYMIHPLAIDAQTIYSIPLSRVNRFWKSAAGMKNVDYENYVLDEDDEWVAEVIWQDSGNRVIDFCDSNGKVVPGSKSYTGNGDDFLYFKPTKAAYGNPCNVIIGLKRKDAEAEDGYLWSWHLWMTDYDPDEDVGRWQNEKYVYEVEGGHVHRYAGVYWTNYNGDKYIMDRNLGARSAKREDGLISNAGFATQYGRKDLLPMAADFQMYDINGGPISDLIIKMLGPVEMYEAVMFPTRFYKTGTSGVSNSDWVRDNEYWKNEWNNIEGASSDKSIFDPCPVGWKVPSKSTWQNFKKNSNVNAVENSWSGETNGWDFYIGGEGSVETAFYPASGWRNLASGEIEYTIATEYWSADVSSATRAYHLYVADKINNMAELPYQNFRSYGFSIRCIQE